MKKILVTGCNGQLGRAIRQEYKGEDVSFINTDVAEGEGIVALDITDVNAVLALVRAERPDVIINCAAHTNVDACEQQWDAAYRINAIGPRNLSIAAREVGAKMIHVSPIMYLRETEQSHIRNLMRSIRSVPMERRRRREKSLSVNLQTDILFSVPHGFMEMEKTL